MVLGGVGSPWVWVLSLPCRCQPSKTSHPECLWEPSRSSPTVPGLQAPRPHPHSHICPARAQQPPCRQPAAAASPAHPWHHRRATETRKAEKPLEKAGPKPHLATSTPVGACSPTCSTSWDCPHCRDLFLDLLLPLSHADTEGMDVHILGAGIHLPQRTCTL